MREKALKARCNNCERSYREHGKLCPWRSISGDYCFDGMNTEEAHREIKKTFDEWKAANCFEIEDLADYFIIHDTENYFVHEKYLEAYEKIESLCKLAFDRE